MGWMDRDERQCDRAEQVIDASNRAFDLAERQPDTRAGRRAAELSETLADRFYEVDAEIRAERKSHGWWR